MLQLVIIDYINLELKNKIRRFLWIFNKIKTRTIFFCEHQLKIQEATDDLISNYMELNESFTKIKLNMPVQLRVGTPMQ